MKRYRIETFSNTWRTWETVWETDSILGALDCAYEEPGTVAVRVGCRRVVVKVTSDIALTYGLAFEALQIARTVWEGGQ